MRYIVIYAASCPACSEVARLVGNASITDLEARPFGDPQVIEALSEAGLAVPDRPALMVIGDTDLQLLFGWAMRRRLAALVGWRRSRTIVRLLAAEWRARLTKSATPYLPSRRGVIGGILAGLTGWAMSSGIANASATPAESMPAMEPADPADAARVLETATAQRAIRTWGPAHQQVLQVSGGRQPALVLMHPDRGIYTFIDNLPGALSRNEPVAVSLGAAPTAGHALRYYTVDGTALADLTVSDGRAIVTPVQPRPGEEEPDIPWQLACFAGCVGRESAKVPGCLNACEACALHSGGGLQWLVQCGICAACAGPNALPCLRECGIL